MFEKFIPSSLRSAFEGRKTSSLEGVREKAAKYAKILTLAYVSLLPQKGEAQTPGKVSGYTPDRQEAIYQEFRDHFVKLYGSPELVALQKKIGGVMESLQRVHDRISEHNKLKDTFPGGIDAWEKGSRMLWNMEDAMVRDIAQWYTLLNRSIPDKEVQEKFKLHEEEFKKAYDQYDAQVTWLRETISSDTYLKRLKKELQNDFPAISLDELNVMAEEIRTLRLKRLDDKDYVLHFGAFTDKRAGQVGYYNPFDESVHIPHVPDEDNVTVGVHERQHDVTDGNDGMTSYAKKTFTEAFRNQGVFETMQESKPDSFQEFSANDSALAKVAERYYSEPTEEDARRVQLWMELDQLGFKKYSEDFTDKDYKKLLKLMEEGKLTRGSREFIRMTDPKLFKQIMNTIAEAPQEKSQDVSV